MHSLCAHALLLKNMRTRQTRTSPTKTAEVEVGLMVCGTIYCVQITAFVIVWPPCQGHEKLFYFLLPDKNLAYVSCRYRKVDVRIHGQLHNNV